MLVVIVGVLVLHVMLIVAFRLAGRHPPALLEFPRMELFMLMCVRLCWLCSTRPVRSIMRCAKTHAVGRRWEILINLVPPMGSLACLWRVLLVERQML